MPREKMLELSGQYLQLQGYRHLAMIGSKNAATDVAIAAFQRGFGGRVTPVLSGRGSMDFRADLQKLHADLPDGLYLLHTGGMAVAFLVQFAASPLKTELPLFGPGTTLDQPVLAASGSAAQDAYSVAPWSDDLDSPANHRMTSEFEGEYGRPPSFQAAIGYDAAMLLDAVVRTADKKLGDEDTVRMVLRRVDFPSTRGPVRFDSNHFPIQSYFLRQVVEDRSGRLVNEQRGVLLRDLRDSHASECPMRWTSGELPAPGSKK
jgi:branched-chain amino acid transport system substrate-binding protein